MVGLALSMNAAVGSAVLIRLFTGCLGEGKGFGMRHVGGVVILLVVVLVGFGFYRGWFHLSTNDTGDRPSATITMDKGKIRADEKKAKAEMPDFGQKAKEKTGDVTGTVKEPERRP